jgi:hypothetical protein
MDSYRFFSILKKVHYIMSIQKLFMKLIQCDYNIQNIVVLGVFLILITFI